MCRNNAQTFSVRNNHAVYQAETSSNRHREIIVCIQQTLIYLGIYGKCAAYLMH